VARLLARARASLPRSPSPSPAAHSVLRPGVIGAIGDRQDPERETDPLQVPPLFRILSSSNCRLGPVVILSFQHLASSLRSDVIILIKILFLVQVLGVSVGRQGVARFREGRASLLAATPEVRPSSSSLFLSSLELSDTQRL